MFSAAEDNTLRELVLEHGEKNWRVISKYMPNRTTRQCRERYKNYLAPNVTNGPWTTEEDLLLEQKYMEYGPKWATIAQFFKNRSDVNIKNRWASNRHKAARTAPFNLIDSLFLPKQQFLYALQALLIPKILKCDKQKLRMPPNANPNIINTITNNQLSDKLKINNNVNNGNNINLNQSIKVSGLEGLENLESLEMLKNFETIDDIESKITPDLTLIDDFEICQPIFPEFDTMF